MPTLIPIPPMKKTPSITSPTTPSTPSPSTPSPSQTMYLSQSMHSTPTLNLPTIAASQLTWDPQQRHLGKGTFGTVYAALLDGAHPVAIKVLRTPTTIKSHQLTPADAHHAHIAARQFEREARRYAALRSIAGVVRFYAVATTRPDSTIDMLVTERMWGGSLKDVLKNAQLDPLSILRVGTSVATTLAEMHRRGFSHGDLKPGNILFSEPLQRFGGKVSKNVQVKLIDFGLSRAFNAEEEEEEDVKSWASWRSAPVDDKAATLLGPGEARGTPAYLSPEAWEGGGGLKRKEVAFRADIWALGMILYQMETGKVPWEGLGQWGIFVAVCQQGDKPKWGEERVKGLRRVVDLCWGGGGGEIVARELRRLRDEMEEWLDMVKEEESEVEVVEGIELEADFEETEEEVEGVKQTEEIVKVESEEEDNVGEDAKATDEEVETDEQIKSIEEAKVMEPVNGSEDVSESEAKQPFADGRQQDDRVHEAEGDTPRGGGGKEKEEEEEGVAKVAPSTNGIVEAKSDTQINARSSVKIVVIGGEGTDSESESESESDQEEEEDRVEPVIAVLEKSQSDDSRDLVGRGGSDESEKRQQDVTTGVTNDVRPPVAPSRGVVRQALATQPSQKHHHESQGRVGGGHIRQETSKVVMATTETLHTETASATTSRGESGGLSLEEGSVNGGYEPDSVSQQNMQSVQNTMSLPPRAGVVNIPQHVGNLDYAFKTEVMNDDCEGLVAALERYERDPKQAVLALDAMGVLLDNNDENCTVLVERGGLRIMSRILSRYGRTEARLCKGCCVVILHLSISGSPIVEKELRTTGACEMVLNSIRWHPTKLPVLQNAACAMNAMCRASNELCKIVLMLGGIDCALRVLARSSGLFRLDVPVACAAFEVLGLVARDHASALVEGDCIVKILDCCDAFHDERIDKHCLSILHYVTQSQTGQDKFLSSSRGMQVFADMIRRIIDGGESASKLAMAFGIVSLLATASKRGVARTSFMYSSIVERVIEGVEHVEKDTAVTQGGKSAVATAGLDCVRNMTALGRDVCGSLQMAEVFQMCRTVVHNHKHERAVAERATIFLEQMLKELGKASFGADLDVVFETLHILEARWKHDIALIRRIKECIRMVQERSSAEEPNPEAATERANMFRVLLRRTTRRNR